MKERFKLSLSGIWLLTSLFSVLLPILLPSSYDAHSFAENVVGTATVSMFILAFPSSLFGLPAMLFAAFALGVNPNSVEGMYLNLFLLFVFGLVQWFWIAPRLLQSESQFQMLNLRGGNSDLKCSETAATRNAEFFNSQMQTPLERIIYERDSE